VMLQEHDGDEVVTDLLLLLRAPHPYTYDASSIRHLVKSSKGATTSFFR
jgi:hypothetical protein